jgi:hypothetical protein
MAIDFCGYELGAWTQRLTNVMLITNRWSRLDMITTYRIEKQCRLLLSSYIDPQWLIIITLRHLLGLLERHYDIKPKGIECDNELHTQNMPFAAS